MKTRQSFMACDRARFAKPSAWSSRQLLNSTYIVYGLAHFIFIDPSSFLVVPSRSISEHFFCQIDAVKKSDSSWLKRPFFRHQWVTHLPTYLQTREKSSNGSLARSLFCRSPTDAAETVAAVSLFSDAAAALAVDRLPPPRLSSVSQLLQYKYNRETPTPLNCRETWHP